MIQQLLFERAESVSLDLVESNDVNRLNKVLELLDLLGKVVNRDFLILDSANNLQLADAIANGDFLG
jgi:hypothetical protein